MDVSRADLLCVACRRCREMTAKPLLSPWLSMLLTLN